MEALFAADGAVQPAGWYEVAEFTQRNVMRTLLLTASGRQRLPLGARSRASRRGSS
jgi:hypothetical protein